MAADLPEPLLRDLPGLQQPLTIKSCKKVLFSLHPYGKRWPWSRIFFFFMLCASDTNSILPPVLQLDMLSYLTVDKNQHFPQHSSSNWSVWVITPPTVSLSLTQSGIFSLIRCLPGAPVWLRSSPLSSFELTASYQGTAYREEFVQYSVPPSLSSHYINCFLPQINISSADAAPPTTYHPLHPTPNRRRNKLSTLTKKMKREHSSHGSTVHPSLPSKSYKVRMRPLAPFLIPQ